MKKLLMLSAAALMIGAAPALAEDGGPGPDGKPPQGKMFEKHDTNGDGVVSKSEFLSHAEERFSKMDADGSGDISSEEAREAHKEMREKRKERREERKEKREERRESAE